MKETKVKGMVKNQKAITLIALVITIIVLLILAGVSIATLTGEHGILGNANKAKLESKIGELEERIKLWKTEQEMSKYTGTKAKDLQTFLNELVKDGLLTQEQVNEIIANENYELVIGDKTLSFYVDGQADMLPKPVISELTYTKDGNNFNINVTAHEEQALEDIYIGKLTKAVGAEYEFIKGPNGTIVNEPFNVTGNLKNIETAKVTSRSHHPHPHPTKVADSYIKVDLTNVTDDIVVNVELNISNAEWGGMIEIRDTPEFYGPDTDMLISGVTTKNITLELVSGKEQYIHFLYGYGYVDEESGITDTLTINKLEINRRIEGSELEYKYIVNGDEQDNNVIAMNATILQGQTAVEGTSPKIPEGFRHLEGTIDGGYVITDIDQNYEVEVEVTNSIGRTKKETIEIKGNEFVWIPVNESNPFERREGYAYGEQQDILSEGEADSEGVNTVITESAETQAESIAMYQSVEENNGFYIGRYETGIEFGKYNDDSWNEYWEGGVAVCKRNADVYNCVPWNEDGSMTNEEGGVVEIARNFASIQGYDTTKVHTTLCYGVQWDTALNFMDPEYTGYAKNSTGKGNDSWELIKTGSNDNYAVKNIYDMAGNVEEWTMEARIHVYSAYYTEKGRSVRGGHFEYNCEELPASVRFCEESLGRGNFKIGFRIAMYL